MNNHYTKLGPKSAQAFSSPDESMLYMLLESDELITLKAWISRLMIYCQQKPQDTKGIKTDPKTVDGHIKLLISKGYVKEIPGEALQRVTNHF